MGRILVFSEIFPPTHGGSGRWFSEIYRRFPVGSVFFVVGNHPQGQAFDANFVHPIHRAELSNDDWGVRSLSGLRFYFRLWRELSRLVKEKNITAIHCGRCLPEGLAAFFLNLTKRVPYSCYVHGEDVETALTSRELTLLTRLVLKKADRIICNSVNSARILKEKWSVDEARVLVMTPGVDVEHFTPGSGVEKKAFWQNQTTILTVGRLQKRKGHDTMIKALPSLVSKFPDLLYVIIGAGEEMESLRVLVSQLGLGEHVSFLGEISDEEMVDCYRSCTLFALPNRRVGNDDEGFGMVLLEAQACGRPVLAGASGGTRETLIENETGILVDRRDPEELSSAVSRLLRDTRHLDEMGLTARQYMEQRFSWDALSQNAINVFLEGSASEGKSDA